MSNQNIRIQLPDGSVREVAAGTTPLDIATSISPRLAAVVVVARIRPLAGTAAANERQRRWGADSAAGRRRDVGAAAEGQEDCVVVWWWHCY